MKLTINIHDQDWQKNVTKPEFAVPEDYFATLASNIIDKCEASSEESEYILDDQKKQLFALARITSIDNGELHQWKVPEGYFEQMRDSIELKTDVQSTEPKKIIRMKPVWWTSIAASVAVLIAFFALYPDQKNPSFDNLLAAYQLEEEDMEWLADGDDLALIYLEESNWQDVDSLILDSSLVKSPKLDSQLVVDPEQNPLPKKSTQKVTWDDITEEEIWEYLMDTGNAEELLDNQ